MDLMKRFWLIILPVVLIVTCVNNISITPPPEPIESPVCIITFDDGLYDVLGTAKPKMENYGFKGDVFAICGQVGNQDFLSWNQLGILDNLGWGIYNHSCSHLPLPDSEDIQCCHDTLIAHGFDGNVFAYPFGAYNDTIVNWVKINHWAARTTDWGLNNHFFASNPTHTLKAVQASGSITPERIEGMIDSCITLNKVLILVYHNFCSWEGCTVTHRIYIGDFQEVLDYLYEKRNQIKVMTFKEYLNRWE